VEDTTARPKPDPATQPRNPSDTKPTDPGKGVPGKDDGRPGTGQNQSKKGDEAKEGKPSEKPPGDPKTYDPKGEARVQLLLQEYEKEGAGKELNKLREQWGNLPAKERVAQLQRLTQNME